MPCGAFVVSLYDVPLQSNVPEANAVLPGCCAQQTVGLATADGTEGSAHWTKGLRSHADRILKNGKLRNHSEPPALGRTDKCRSRRRRQRLKVAQEQSPMRAR